MAKSQADTDLANLRAYIGRRNLTPNLDNLPAVSSLKIQCQMLFNAEPRLKVFVGNDRVGCPTWLCFGVVASIGTDRILPLVAFQGKEPTRPFKLQRLDEVQLVEPFKRLWERTPREKSETRWWNRLRDMLKGLMYWYTLNGAVRSGSALVVPEKAFGFVEMALRALGEQPFDVSTEGAAGATQGEEESVARPLWYSPSSLGAQESRARARKRQIDEVELDEGSDDVVITRTRRTRHTKSPGDGVDRTGWIIPPGVWGHITINDLVPPPNPKEKTKTKTKAKKNQRHPTPEPSEPSHSARSILGDPQSITPHLQSPSWTRTSDARMLNLNAALKAAQRKETLYTHRREHREKKAQEFENRAVDCEAKIEQLQKKIDELEDKASEFRRKGYDAELEAEEFELQEVECSTEYRGILDKIVTELKVRLGNEEFERQWAEASEKHGEGEEVEDGGDGDDGDS